jgi:DNA-binding NarL/FixJ family response regulator
MPGYRALPARLSGSAANHVRQAELRRQDGDVAAAARMLELALELATRDDGGMPAWICGRLAAAYRSLARNDEEGGIARAVLRIRSDARSECAVSRSTLEGSRHRGPTSQDRDGRAADRARGANALAEPAARRGSRRIRRDRHPVSSAMQPAPRRVADEGPPIRIVIADDNAGVRDGLRAHMMGQSGFSVVAEATDGKQAWVHACALCPDVLLLDLSMPGMSGLEAAERITADCPTVRIVVLTMHEERSYVARLTQAGVAGYVLKRTAVALLIDAIRVVAGGGSYVDPAVDGTSESDVAIATTPEPGGEDVELTAQEATLLRLVARGLSNREIAVALCLSGPIVARDRATGMTKLGLNSRAALIRHATERGWLKLEC